MTAFTLKCIALASMMTDHAAVALPDIVPSWFRVVGRLAWVIFAVLVADSFKHTTNKKKFLLRLFILAIVSQVPYNLVLSSASYTDVRISFIQNTNIFYTLFLGGLAICIYQYFLQKGKPTLAVVTSLVPTALIAEWMTADYGGLGVLFVFMMYAVSAKWLKHTLLVLFSLSQFVGYVLMIMAGESPKPEEWLMIPAVLLGVILVLQHNDRRGRNMKWLFYAAYPAHLMFLYFVTLYIK